MTDTKGNSANSSSLVQIEAEKEIFDRVQKLLNIELEKNATVYLPDKESIYIQPDIYSREHLVIGEIFAHIGKPKKAQDNKIANDILKMLLLERLTGQQYRKLIIVCDTAEKEKLEGKSALAEAIRQFGIELMLVDISEELRVKILEAQKLQKMTNA